MGNWPKLLFSIKSPFDTTLLTLLTNIVLSPGLNMMMKQRLRSYSQRKHKPCMD